MSVNYVIFYEPVPSEVRFIQRRGRASRGEGGECIILITKDSRDEGYYWSAINKERKMKRLLKDMQKILNEKLEEQNRDKYIIEDRSSLDYILNKENKDDKKENVIKDNVIKEEIKEIKENEKNKEKIEEFEKDSKKEDIKNTEFEIKNTNTQKPIKIVVDNREKIVSRYLFDKAELEFKNLENGDYILSDRVIVERKTAEDFESSIIDKRLFKQLKDLKKYERPILIIEGNNYFRLSEKIVNGAVISIMLDFNIPVMFSKDVEETANILVKMAEREQLKNKRTITIRTGKKPMSLKERQRFIVESFPDVGALTAENLLMKFGTIENIVNASEDELMEVGGVGKITAKKIKAVLTEKYEK
jgi:Fanconi anemia group M protein